MILRPPSSDYHQEKLELQVWDNHRHQNHHHFNHHHHHHNSRKNPSAFLDANHKPEMAIALTNFTALCGWRSLMMTPSNKMMISMWWWWFASSPSHPSPVEGGHRHITDWPCWLLMKAQSWRHLGTFFVITFLVVGVWQETGQTRLHHLDNPDESMLKGLL